MTMRRRTAKGLGRKSFEGPVAATRVHDSITHPRMTTTGRTPPDQRSSLRRCRTGFAAISSAPTASGIVLPPGQEAPFGDHEEAVHQEADDRDGDHARHDDVRFEIAVAVHDEEAEARQGDHE